MKLKQAVANKLTKKEMQHLRGSFDIIGDIAVLEIPPEVEKKEKIIAKILMDLHKNIKVVVKKIGGHKGIYRRQKMKIILGERRKKTEHKEAGVRLKVHVENTYFSPRVSNERLRIAKQVKKGEEILVMFSGISPYSLVITRNSEPKSVIGIEMNSEAHKLALENIKINKMQEKVRAIKGDVRKEIPKLNKKFHRIIMPLPKTAEKFLDIALSSVKKGGIIHFYAFAREEEFINIKEKIKKVCKESKKKCKIQRIVKVGQQSPRVYRICIDIKIT